MARIFSTVDIPGSPPNSPCRFSFVARIIFILEMMDPHES